MFETRILVIAYGLIGIIGVIGNVVLLLTLPKVQHFRAITKKFIANIAIIDLSLNIIDVPFKIIKIIHPDLKDNPFSIALIRCKVIPYIFETLVAALINTLVGFTIERYISIVHPFTIISKKQYKMMTVIIWSSAVILSLPEILIKHLSELECVDFWQSESLKYSYYVVDTIENCVAPLCIVIYCYVTMCKTLKNRRIPGERIASERASNTVEKNRIKLMRISFVVTIYYVLSGLPLYIIFYIYEFKRAPDEPNQARNGSYLHHWLDWLALTHLCVNPFLYCFMSGPFRNSFKKLLKCGSGPSTKARQQSIQHRLKKSAEIQMTT